MELRKTLYNIMVIYFDDIDVRKHKLVDSENTIRNIKLNYLLCFLRK